MGENNDNPSHDGQGGKPDLDNHLLVETNDYNPYQTSKTLLEQAELPAISLKRLAAYFCWIYFLIYIIFFAIMFLVIFSTNGALWIMAAWLFIFSFVIIPYISYRRTLGKIPLDAPISLFSQFMAVAIVISIALPFIVSFLVFGLCSVIFY